MDRAFNGGTQGPYVDPAVREEHARRAAPTPQFRDMNAAGNQGRMQDNSHIVDDNRSFRFDESDLMKHKSRDRIMMDTINDRVYDR